MAKLVHSYTPDVHFSSYSVGSDIDIGTYSSALASLLSDGGIGESFTLSTRGSRLYAYSDVLMSCASEFFRSRHGIVYVHDGRIWSPVSYDAFRLIVRDAFVCCAGEHAERAKGDWVDKERKIVDYAVSGATRSELPYSPALVGFVNGVWDFSDASSPVHVPFEERPAVTSLLPYAYDESAVCPVWLSFLSTMLPDHDVRVLQKFFALGCLDRKQLPHVVEESLWLVGDGANGKSTIERVLTGVFGRENVGNTNLDSLLDRNIDARMRAVASIEGRLFNVSEEISSTDIARGSDAFKSLVSGSPQQARAIGRDIWTVYDVPFLLFSMNQIPPNKRMDDAFRRRMAVIHFRSSVRQEDMDRSLASKLAEEYSGIRNWAMQGIPLLEADRWRIGRQGRGGAMDDENVDTLIQSGLTVDIWKDAAGLSASRHVGHEDEEVCLFVRAADLYADYCNFCTSRLLCECVSQNQFGRDMSRLRFISLRRSRGKCYEVYCDARNKFNNPQNNESE